MSRTLPLPALRLVAAPSRPCFSGLTAAGTWNAPLLFVISLAVYLRTVAPVVYSLDSAELTVAAYTLGIAHPTGYPTYLLLAHPLTRVPFWNPGFGANLLSAICVSATIVLVYLIACRLTGHRMIAWLGALGLAFSYFFWSAAVVAEVYPLHVFFLALLIYLLLPRTRPLTSRRLIVTGLIFGLSLGNHLATLLLAPGLVCLLLWPLPGRRVEKRAAFLGLLALIVGLAVYLYLPVSYLAQSGINVAGHYDEFGRFVPVNLVSWDGLRWMLTAETFRGSMFAYPPDAVLSEVGNYLNWLRGNFLGIGLPLGLLGAVELVRRRPREGVSLLLLFFANGIFYVNYSVADKQTMFLPTYVVWALWLVVGCGELTRLLRAVGLRRGPSYLPAAAWIVPGMLVVVTFAALVINFPLVDLSGDRSSYQWAQQVFDQVEPDGLVLGAWKDVSPLMYLQVIEGARPDVQVIHKAQIAPNAQAGLVRRTAGVRPVYWLGSEPPDFELVMARPLAQMAGYQLVPAGP